MINETILKEIPNLNIDDNKLSLLKRYKEIVLDENRKYNLTNITSNDEFIIKHFYDALIGSIHLDFNDKTILDIGSGAGFPGLVLAIIYDSSRFYLVEPMLKRAIFLNKVKEELKLNNVIVINKRVEDLDDKEFFDIATSRAVSKLNILLELSIPFLKINGSLLAYKGLKSSEEINEAKNAFKELSCHVEKIFIDNLPIFYETRSNIIIKKDKKTKPIYPRNYSKIKKGAL